MKRTMSGTDEHGSRRTRKLGKTRSNPPRIRSTKMLSMIKNVLGIFKKPPNERGKTPRSQRKLKMRGWQTREVVKAKSDHQLDRSRKSGQRGQKPKKVDGVRPARKSRQLADNEILKKEGLDRMTRSSVRKKKQCLGSRFTKIGTPEVKLRFRKIRGACALVGPKQQRARKLHPSGLTATTASVE